MADIQYSKFGDGNSIAAYNKQKNFFDHARSDTGFQASDAGGLAAQAGLRHSSMAAADVLKLSRARLDYLKRHNVIHFDTVRDGLVVQTMRARELATALPRLARDESVRLLEVRALDDSLESLFRELVR